MSLLLETWHRVHALLVWLVLLPVAVYRRVVSPMKRTPTCRFLPTCSEYATLAVRERGIVLGVMLAMWRMVRCNPLFRGGYDPVPQRAPCSHSRRSSRELVRGVTDRSSGPAHCVDRQP